VSITLEAFSYYVNPSSDDNVLVLIEGNTIPPTYSNGNSFFCYFFLKLLVIPQEEILPGNIKTFDFISKTINPDKAPIRIRFHSNSVVNTPTIKLELGSQYEWSSNVNIFGFIRTYTPDFFLDTSHAASSVIVTDHVIKFGFAFTIPNDSLLELVVETIENDLNEDPHFKWPSDPGDEIKLTILAGPNPIHESVVPVYPYAPVPYVKINEVYYTTLESGIPNSLILDVTADFDDIDDPSFPNVLMELELTSALPLFSSPTIVPCGLSVLTKREKSLSIRCTYVPSQPPKIRVEGFDEIANGNFHLIFDNLDNDLLTKNFIGYFDAKLVVTTVSGYRSQSRLSRLFTPVSTTASPSTSDFDFPELGDNFYGQKTTLTQDFTLADDCTSSQCLLVVQGKETDWKFRDNVKFSIDNTEQTSIIDQVNNRISKKVFFI